MTQTVLKLPLATIKQMEADYHNCLQTKKTPYTHFVAKLPHVTITAYQSGKVMFQGKQAAEAAAKWQPLEQPQQANGKQPKKTCKSDIKLPTEISQMAIIGSDEVGNGSYLGPLVVCAAYADKKQLPILKQLGVKDSKALKDDDIKRIAQKIKPIISFQLLTVEPAKYNQIQPQYNAVRMKVALHNRAIFRLKQKIAPTKPEAILIDQFTPEKNYRKYLQQEKEAVTENLFFITKGEQYHLAVAAASIICRATFLEWLTEESRKIDILLPSGAGKNADLAAAQLLKKGGIALLEQYAKLHFANTEKAQKLARLI